MNLMNMIDAFQWVTLIIFYLLIQWSKCSSERNLDYVRVPVLDNILKEEFLLQKLLAGSRLSCGTKCTEIHDQCLSYAWNRATGDCFLYVQKIHNIPTTFQNENYWEHYNLRECSADLMNGRLDVSDAFIAGAALSGSCNVGFVAVSGQIIATCDREYNTNVSDQCWPLLQNVAVGKPAVQSSTHLTDIAGNAVDGDRSADLITGTCSHTDNGDVTPWWRVDLLNVYYVVTVRILNRGMDQFGKDESHRLKNVTVSAGLTSSDISNFCGFFAGPGTLSQLVTIPCPPSTIGRIVQISIVSEHLTLCEVDVFAVAV